MAPTFNSASSSQGLQLSPSNFVYNYIGHFAAAGHATAKAIFLGGVTRRFPQLHFAFLEGGVGWASQLFGDLVEHWERRSAKALERMHPDKLDRTKLLSLVEQYGYGDFAAALREREGLPDPQQAYLTGNLDDFSAMRNQPQGGLGRAIRQTLLFRLRSRRPDERRRPSAGRTGSAPGSMRSSARISGISM